MGHSRQHLPQTGRHPLWHRHRGRDAADRCLRTLIAAGLIAALATPVVATPQIVAARGRWAALVEGQSCNAATRALAPALKGRPQAKAALAFDAGGPRRGQFSAQLSRPPRADASVMLAIGDVKFLLVARGDMAWSRGPAQEQAIIAAMRTGQWFSVEARSAASGRFVDRYSLDGAPLAIDAAAACAARLANR